jgi:hypothetical protein
MRKAITKRRSKQRRDSGAAMLIAVFALLLISVVAIALVVSSGTDSSLAGNYRTATSAYYAATAGLEEARGRVLWKNADFINKTGTYTNVLFDASGARPAWCLNRVLYIINPAVGETVDPADPANPYYDSEYGQEFPPAGLSAATVLPYIMSDSAGAAIPTGGTLPGPSYKWVRINPVTEQALNIDVDGHGIQPGLLYYDPANLNRTNQPAPGLVVSTQPPFTCPLAAAPTPTSIEPLEITALAVAPNGGGHRLLQYLVAPLIISPDTLDQSFPAALTLDGNGVSFDSPGTANYFVNVYNGCPVAPSTMIYSIAYTNAADFTNIQPQVAPSGNYSGVSAPCAASSTGLLAPPFVSPPAPPGYTSGLIRATWQTPATLDAVMQDIENSADVVINGSATSATISAQAPTMSAANPMTVVVNGNLRLNGNGFVGYGLLLVTGTLSYDPDTSWNGIVLVVGQGMFVSSGSTVGTGGGITGTVFVAQTRNSTGNLLATMGSSCFGTVSTCGALGFGHGHHGFGGGYGSNPGKGISYSSASISSAQGPLTYKVLSFHEIPLPN